MVKQQEQYRKCHPQDNREAATQEYKQQTSKVSAKMRTNIVKLLTELLDKQIKYN